MAPRPKYIEVANIITRRIDNGDYFLKDIPGERRIADATGVSYMTARKAVNELLTQRILSRKENGALKIHPSYNRKLGKIHTVFLYPSYPSNHLNQCRSIVTEALNEHDAILRPLQYTHWDDPVLLEAFDNADGIILIASTEPITAHALSQLNMQNNKVVIFDSDFTEQGIPSIQLFPREHLYKLFEHVAKQCGKKIDLLNTQGHDNEIYRRIDLWKSWAKENGIETNVWDDPAPAFTDSRERAYKLTKKLIDKKSFNANAIICTTQDVAVGASRACHDRSIQIGDELSICSINIGAEAKYFYPSITGLDFPVINKQLKTCIDWFSPKVKNWKQSLLLTSSTPNLFLGESTGH
ncbi:substrate-binding domain-containing protein [Planctomycetota bacterium]|nr:substrate-binding domain-containing protein [Planctomycetota bacterium]